ncbi:MULTISPECIES: hypothetical protein [Kitasatospora]|uniref:PH domain-containing protein n=1 Tax=Kitasatospora setae (strain ATCC 33774 / DSM 43861 / JCM 3304 / KCC A-0304 / NBRC 14216 / KM-6054) TaxID=452652 RepID=E4N5X7_KITSK|nr:MULTISPECIES: hypothetical protein [Kitasatospora]BAJ26608.1 hypothetical protein KSE_07680 [Kitasatospora setae KM-6054]
MEFTISGRIRRRGLRLVGWSAPGVLGFAGWAAASTGDRRNGALALLALSAGLLLRGVGELRRLRKPFRLRLDDAGITLHDAELPWSAVESIALRHPPKSAEDDSSSAPPPRLVLRLAPGAELPRTGGSTGRGAGGHGADPDEHVLLDSTDLDQPLHQLVEALREFAGHRLETAPRQVLPPGPRDRHTPERGGVERQFTARPGARARARLALAPAATALCAAPLAVGAACGGTLDSEPRYGLFALPAALFGWLSVRATRRHLRPLRLRIGPDGIGLREPAGPEWFARWADVSAVSTSPLPHTVGTGPHLVVYAAPGADLPFPRMFVDRGHRGYALLPLDRLPDRGREVPAALRAFAPDRYTGPD